MVKWSRNLVKWSIQISPTLGISLVLSDTMWIDLCKVRSEMKCCYNYALVIYSIMCLHPHFHPRHTPNMCDFNGNISNLCFYRVESYHRHHPKSNQP
jgi:hypothetical protein